MKNKKTLLHLSLIDGIGPVTIKKLVNNCPQNMQLSDLYKLGTTNFMQLFGLTQNIAQKIVVGLADENLLAQEINLIEKYKTNWTALGQPDYPQMLAEIYAPPAVLYWIGDPIFHDHKTVAIIGSRKAHRYGERAIEQFVPQLVQSGWTIVSGGAIGADSMAHRATVQASGKTVVVLGSGLLYLYPASNRHLFESVVQSGGALVSVFPMATQAKPGNFPARNRIIAGLSRGCVVVQAAKKSGARITAQFALEQGREVFAVPGPIDDELSAGCNALIQEGAKLVWSVEDILIEFSGEFGFTPKKREQVKRDVGARISLEPPVEKKEEHPEDQSIQGQIVRACVPSCSTDDLSLKLGIDVEQLHELLFDLQLAGRIRQNFAGLWERIA